MRIVTGLLLVLALGLWSGAALADPNSPPEAKEWHYNFGPATATYAETGPNDTCPGPQVLQCGDVINPGLIDPATDADYYQVYLTAGSTVTIATDASELGDPDVGDSYLYFYNPSCVLLTSDDDSGPGLYSQITNYPITTTGYYNIKVTSYYGYYTGYYKLMITCSVPTPPPANDTCAGAIPIERCTNGLINGDLTYATNNYDPGVPGPSCTGYTAAGKDVVYVTTLQTGDQVALVYTGLTFDSSIYIITDCGNVSGTCVAGADQAYNIETINWTCTIPGTYYIVADAYGTNTGVAFTLQYTITCPPPPVPGACCTPDGQCLLVLQPDCLPPNTWNGATSCDPNPCPPPPPPLGACCTPVGECLLIAQSDCVPPNFWDGSPSCNPNPCPQTPTERGSWGQIKNQYR